MTINYEGNGKFTVITTQGNEIKLSEEDWAELVYHHKRLVIVGEDKSIVDEVTPDDGQVNEN